MTYTVKPSELYEYHEVCKILDRGYEIVDFRPSRRGEDFIGRSVYSDKHEVYSHPLTSDFSLWSNSFGQIENCHVGTGPRLIIRKKQSKNINSFWE